MRNMKHAATPLAAMAVAAVALVGATAGSSAPVRSAPPSPIKAVLKQVAGKSPKRREAILYNLAKKEGGTLNWYTSLSRTIGPGVIKAFEAKYSGIKVSMFRGASEDVTARLYQEAAAGTSGADVVETNGTEMTFYQHKKTILVPYRGSPYAKAIPASYRFDTWTGDRVEAFVVAWNTNLLSNDQRPKSWSDLTSSRFSGKLAMEPTDVDWYATVHEYLEKQALAKLRPHPKAKAARQRALRKADAKIDTMFRGIARNARLVNGHTTQATLLAAGQFAVCVSCHAQSIEALIQKHAPITFKPFAAPAIVRAQGVGIVYRLKHPATALLFYDWLLRGDGGQKALLDGGANPARPDMTDPDLKAAKRIRLNLRPIVAHFKSWSDKYDALTRLANGG